jgi:hypothetical protein
LDDLTVKLRHFGFIFNILTGYGHMVEDLHQFCSLDVDLESDRSSDHRFEGIGFAGFENGLDFPPIEDLFDRFGDFSPMPWSTFPPTTIRPRFAWKTPSRPPLFTAQQRSMLLGWLRLSGVKYATQGQVAYLSNLTGLSYRQVRTFIANYRLRSRKRLAEFDSMIASQSVAPKSVEKNLSKK